MNFVGKFLSDIEFVGNSSNKLFVNLYRVEERVDDFCVVDCLFVNEGWLIVVLKFSKVCFIYIGFEKDLKYRFDFWDVVVVSDDLIYIVDCNYGIY